MSPRESASWVPKHTSSESIWYPIVTMSIHSKKCIKCSQIHKSIQSDKNKISKGKLNSSQQYREGKTPYDPTILTKPAIHQDHDISRTREREREIKHIASGTYPQPWWRTTPSSSRRAPRWWRWPLERDSPLRQGAGTGLDRFSVATKASGGGTPDLWCSWMFSGYMELYRQKKHVRGATGAPRGKGHALGGWARPHPCGQLPYLLTWGPSPSGVFPSKNNFSSWFRSVSLRLLFLSFKTLK